MVLIGHGLSLEGMAGVDHRGPPGEGGSGLVQNWLPFLPTLLPPSGCQISLEINL